MILDDIDIKNNYTFSLKWSQSNRGLRSNEATVIAPPPQKKTVAPLWGCCSFKHDLRGFSHFSHGAFGIPNGDPSNTWISTGILTEYSWDDWYIWYWLILIILIDDTAAASSGCYSGENSGRFFGAVSPVGDPLAGSGSTGARSTTASAIDEVWNLGIKVIVPGEHPATYPPQISILWFGYVWMLQIRIIFGFISTCPVCTPSYLLGFPLGLIIKSSSGLCQQLGGQMSQHNLQICEQAPATVTMFILSENITKYCYYPQFQWILRFSDYSPDFPC